MKETIKHWLVHRWNLILAVLAVLFLASGLTYIPTDQQAVVIRLGKLLPGRMQPGLHYRWPYPIDRVVKMKINEAQRFSVGLDDLDRTLGMSSRRNEDYVLTGDQNLVRLQISIQYYILEPAEYLFTAEKLPVVLESLLWRCLSQAVAHRSVDGILTTDRVELQNEILEYLQDQVQQLQLGVQVTTLALEGAHPPEEVRDAFLDVANAREDRNRIIQEARGYSSQLLPRTRGEARENLSQAQIYQVELVQRARGQSERFLKLWNEYRDHRQVTTSRLFLETMEEILPRVRKVILDDAGNPEGLDLDIFEVQTETGASN